MSKKNIVPYLAPDFQLLDSEGKLQKLKNYQGNWLVLYFYPKDDTPGCTIEACSFRDGIDELTDLGARVIGISKDSPESHQKFKSKYNLNFTLLSDESLQTIKAYGAWGKKMFGREGILRQTFIINPQGKVVKVYGRVIPTEHAQKVVLDLKNLIKDKERK